MIPQLIAQLSHCSIVPKYTHDVRVLYFGPAPGSAVASPFVASWANSSSYRPRYWNPWDRNVTTLSSIFPLSQVLYVSFSFSYISNWLALPSKAASFTLLLQFSTGPTASQTPQPHQAPPPPGAFRGEVPFSPPPPSCRMAASIDSSFTTWGASRAMAPRIRT